jgi:hypothetical protein
MALLAETLVDEWLNRAGFFTVRGLRSGVDEIDLLAVRPQFGLAEYGTLEAWHVEVQVSVNPVAYISSLTDKHCVKYKKKRTSAWARPPEVLSESVAAWVEKKFLAAKKQRARNLAWRHLDWSFHFVHGKVRHPAELALIQSYGITLVPFHEVLATLCARTPEAAKGGAGTDIAEILGYYLAHRDAAA